MLEDLEEFSENEGDVEKGMDDEELMSDDEVWTIRDRLGLAATTWMISFLLLSTHLCRLATGFNRPQFESLLADMREHIEKTTLRGGVRHATSPHWLISTQFQLFITLFHLRHYPPFWMLSLLFFLPTKYVHKVVKRVVSALARFHREQRAAAAAGKPVSTKGVVHWPTPAELERLRSDQVALHNLGLTSVDAATDGIHVRVHARKEQKSSTWAPWLKGYFVTWIITFDLFGRILDATHMFLHNSESTIIQHEALAQELRVRGIGCVGDAKFALNLKETPVSERGNFYFTLGPRTLACLKYALRMGAKGDFEAFCVRWLLNTTSASQMRVVAENGIHRIRQWAVVATAYRAMGDGMYTATLDDVFEAILFLTNRLLIDTPCRSENWVPKNRSSTGEPYKWSWGPDNCDAHLVNSMLVNVELKRRAKQHWGSSFEFPKTMRDEDVAEADELAGDLSADVLSYLVDTYAGDGLDVARVVDAKKLSSAQRASVEKLVNTFESEWSRKKKRQKSE